jgi:GGDEF domain-containing protein
LRESDIIARLGGDEFVVILPEIEDDEVALVAQKLLAAVMKPVMLSGAGMFQTGEQRDVSIRAENPAQQSPALSPKCYAFASPEPMLTRLRRRCILVAGFIVCEEELDHRAISITYEFADDTCAELFRLMHEGPGLGHPGQHLRPDPGSK